MALVKVVNKPFSEIENQLLLNKGGKIQKFKDEKIATNLMAYVSFDKGNQQKSIPISSVYGSGYVTIDVPYAEYQAYSKRIKKRVGKRGTFPFERMVADKGEGILNEVAIYSRRNSK